MEPVSRIVNGEPMDPGTHPFMVALVFDNKFCNGVIIGTNLSLSIINNIRKCLTTFKQTFFISVPDAFSILTTATCLAGQTSVKAYIGTHDLANDDTEPHMDTRNLVNDGENFIIHEDYDPVDIKFDLGMIHLAEPMEPFEYSKYIGHLYSYIIVCLELPQKR